MAYLGLSSPGRTRTAVHHYVRVLPLPLGHRAVILVSGPTQSCTEISSVRSWCLPVGPWARSSGRRGTRTPKRACRRLFSRQVPHPAGCLPCSSCGGWNRTNIKAFRAPRPTVRRPRIIHSRHACHEKARREGLEPSPPASKAGRLPLSDPRLLRVSCGSRTHLASLEGWYLCRSVKDT